MFAVITPALITGAFAERVRFKAWIVLSLLWSLLIYVPIAHSVWAVGGYLRNEGTLDFAGGLVVHMTAGYSALVFAKFLRPRQDFGMVLLGTSLLLFGWFGFNAGSALAANGLAGHAFANTFFAAAAAMVDLFVKGKPTLIGAHDEAEGLDALEHEESIQGSLHLLHSLWARVENANSGE